MEAGAGSMPTRWSGSRKTMIYRWKDRKADLERPASQWPVLIEFTLLAVPTLLAIGAGIMSAVERFAG